MLNISTRTVDRLRCRGLLTSIIFMSRIRFRLEDIEALLRVSRRSGSQSAPETHV